MKNAELLLLKNKKHDIGGLVFSNERVWKWLLKQ